MARLRRYLFWLLLPILAACAPTFDSGAVTGPPEGASLTLEAAEGYSVLSLTIPAPGDVWLTVLGDVSVNAAECQPSEAGQRCRVGQVADSYHLPVAGEVTGAAALVCGRVCYALRLE